MTDFCRNPEAENMAAKRTQISRILLAWSIAVAAPWAWGQTQAIQPTEQTALRGILPTGSYAVSDIETVNAQNGNVFLRIPIASLPPGRGGLQGGLSLIYNSKIWAASASYQVPSVRGGACS